MKDKVSAADLREAKKMIAYLELMTKKVEAKKGPLTDAEAARLASDAYEEIYGEP